MPSSIDFKTCQTGDTVDIPGDGPCRFIRYRFGYATLVRLKDEVRVDVLAPDGVLSELGQAPPVNDPPPTPSAKKG